MKLQILFDLIEKEKIVIEYVDFSPTIQGIYYKADGCLPIIGINENIVSNKKLFTCVLAEELGHHFTSIGDSTAESYSIAGRISLNKTELAALKWATEFLLPLEEIKRLVKKGVTNIDDLADLLNVTNEFLIERFRFISKKQAHIKIKEDLLIILTNLPNIYLYEKPQKIDNDSRLVAEDGVKYGF